MDHVLGSDPQIAEAADAYYDDIMIDSSKVSAERVVEVLDRFGLETKPPVKINGGRVLGLAVRKTDGELRWHRNGNIPALPDRQTRRKLFSGVGQLVGHFPVGGWLRPACSFLKRLACRGGWDDTVEPRVVDIAQKLAACERRPSERQVGSTRPKIWSSVV